MPSRSVSELKNRLYSHQIDGTSLFRNLILDVVRPTSIVVDLGCGKGKERTDVRAHAGLVVGCDIQDDVASNPFVNEAVRGDAYAIPLRDDAVDVLIADFLFEHLAEPEVMARETFRVLRPGGAFAFRTPNLMHYVSLIGAATPHWFHRAVANRARGIVSRDGHDIFETYYRLNTRKAIRRTFGRVGFITERLLMVEREPSYLMFARIPFLIGVLYERLVNRYDWLAGCRSNIFAVMRKPT